MTPLYTVLPTVGLFNDDVLLGDRSAIGAFVARHLPRVIITNDLSVTQRPSVLPILAQYYDAAYRIGTDTIYVRGTDAQPVTASAAPPDEQVADSDA